MSRPLHPDVMLGIHLSTICSRNRYETDAAPVIAELLEAAGDRDDVLAMEAGKWAGYYDDKHTAALVAAIIAEIPGAAEWARVGRERRSVPAHGTAGFGPAYVPARQTPSNNESPRHPGCPPKGLHTATAARR